MHSLYVLGNCSCATDAGVCSDEEMNGECEVGLGSRNAFVYV